MKERFSIEFFELGYWEEIDLANSLEDAVCLADAILRGKFSKNFELLNSVDAAKFDARVRIVTPDCKII
jgi:hypothetical protein